MLYIRLCCGQQTNSSEPDRDVSFPQLPTVWVGSESVNSSALLLPNTLYALYQGLGLHFILLQERFYLFYFVKFLLSLQEQNQSQLIKKKKKKTIRNLPSWPGHAGWVYLQLLQVATHSSCPLVGKQCSPVAKWHLCSNLNCIMYLLLPWADYLASLWA